MQMKNNFLSRRCSEKRVQHIFPHDQVKDGYYFRSLVPSAKFHESLCQTFSVLLLFQGEYVAQFKFTVMLMANGPLRITNGPFEPELYKSEFEVQDPELKVRDLNAGN